MDIRTRVDLHDARDLAARTRGLLERTWKRMASTDPDRATVDGMHATAEELEQGLSDLLGEG